jgi:hypothetical protein
MRVAMKVIIDRLYKIIYADIEPLEVFQAALLIFYTPLNLMQAGQNNYFIYSLSIASMILGLVVLYCVSINNLSLRLLSARIHWVINLLIMIHVFRCSVYYNTPSLIAYYVIQSFFCLFVISRLLFELNSRKGE